MILEKIQLAYPAFLEWILVHGLRIFFIFAGAVFLSIFLRNLIGKKNTPTSVLSSTLDKYKEKINAEQQKRVATIIKVVGAALSYSIYIIALLMILPEFGLSIAPLLAGVGLAGLAVGMASKDILTDFIAGLFILIEDQYNVGDDVAIAGVKGKVKEITLRRTVIESEGGEINLVPNREIKVVTRKLSN